MGANYEVGSSVPKFISSCWENDPESRPRFKDISMKLERLLSVRFVLFVLYEKGEGATRDTISAQQTNIVDNETKVDYHTVAVPRPQAPRVKEEIEEVTYQ